jgi:NMD protein affecting ribosome stability and mRNA decay
MGFNIQCDNKGCHKYQEPKLDVETNEALCDECGEPIKSVTIFAKTQMRHMGQIYRGAEKKQQAFAVTCKACNKHGRPKVANQKDLMCAFCGVELELAGPFKQTLLTFLNIGK